MPPPAAEPACDVAVVGGGIVGLATARALAERLAGRAAVRVLEAEPEVAAHQTGHNSGVIHSGLYYAPGSLKARLCAEGREAMFRFCADRGVPHRRCGKLVVAVRPEELARLDALEARGRTNGLEGMVRLGPGEIAAHEPHAAGLAALWVPQTGVTDYRLVAAALARDLEARGGRVTTGAALQGVRREPDGLVLDTAAGSIRARYLVACAGLWSDRVARLCGVAPGVRIVPFRGEYHRLRPERAHLVRHLVYPVPDPRFPFLGVHFTRGIDGEVHVGPNALLALSRRGYRRGTLSPRDAAESLGDPAVWRLMLRYWRIGASEILRSRSRHLLARALAAMVPEVRAADLEPAGAGIRAQALDLSGALVDDFRIVEAERMVHVLNAPSPAATAALAIGRTVAERAAKRGVLA